MRYELCEIMDCLFCQIIEGKIPSYKVYEDDQVLAFLDIAPVNPGHTLVIPKKHYENIEEISPEDLNEVIKKIGKSVKDNLGVPAYNCIQNNGSEAGQIIPHLHFHVIPRVKGDGLGLWPQGKYGDGEAKETAKLLAV